MKLGKYKPYFRWGITAFGVIAASMLFYYFVFHFEKVREIIALILDILSPVLIGLIIAYCLSPLIRIMEQKVLPPVFQLLKLEIKPKSRKKIRGILIACTYLLVLACIYGLIAALIPQIIASFGSLLKRMPYYMRSTETFITRSLSAYPDLQETMGDVFSSLSEKVNDFFTNTFLPAGSSFVLNLSSSVVSAVGTVFDVLVGAIIAIYLLFNKERYIGLCKKAMYATFSLETATGLIKDLKYVNQEFTGFLTGKVIDSILIGIICYICTTIIGTPYALLVSLIIGVTNIIPFFGPFLGAVPCVLLILMIQPIQALYFMIFVIVLQQFDGNYLGPRILGRTTGISSFLIIISILIGSGLFGVFGMIIAVPICGIICTMLRNSTTRKLEEKNLPQSNDFYIQNDYIDSETGESVPYAAEKRVVAEENLFRFRIRNAQKQLRKALKQDLGEEAEAGPSITDEVLESPYEVVSESGEETEYPESEA